MSGSAKHALREEAARRSVAEAQGEAGRLVGDVGDQAALVLEEACLAGDELLTPDADSPAPTITALHNHQGLDQHLTRQPGQARAVAVMAAVQRPQQR